LAATLRVEDRPGPEGQGLVRLLTLSNPSRRNAVDPAVLALLAQECERAARDAVRAMVLAGEGQAFCAGYDFHALEEGVAQMAQAAQAGPQELLDAPLVRACAALEACPAILIAAVDGPAFGAGAELSCACDLRVASRGAKFSLPPAKLGVVYSPEGIARIVRLVGLPQARRLFFTAAVAGAEEALSIGLCEEVVEGPSAVERALALAAEIAALAPLSLAGMKRTFALLAPRPDEAARLELEELRRAAFASSDTKEGVLAFRERRAPRFKGQ
jgi:enoyl-CoA hydratase/carnithine racemase